MRDYEVMVIIQPDLDEASLTGLIEKISGWITESGGVIVKKDVWGKRRLAYSIRKQREGVYVLFTVQMAPTFATELERNLLYTESVLRFLVTTAGE